MLTDPDRVPIGRRAWIGDGRHGASVGADGTMDWYCPAGITAPPELWRLLDPAGAAVRVGPVSRGSARRPPGAQLGYLDDTNIAVTSSRGAGGRVVEVLDFFPWPGPGLDVPGVVVRLVRARSGPVEVEVEIHPGPRRGPSSTDREVSASTDGLLVAGGVEVRAGSPFSAFASSPIGREERWRATARLDAGQEAVVLVAPRGSGWAGGVGWARRLLEDTERAWRSWLSPLWYGGPYRDAVARCLLATRSLTGPSGAPAGAGTTSLPRRPGSDRSGDERWVRVRSAARAVAVLAAAGLAEDAEAAESWLRQALTGADVPWPEWLDEDGQPVPEAEELPFEGWRRSGPVLTGRRAARSGTGLPGEVIAAYGSSRVGPWSAGRGARPEAGPLSAAWQALAAAANWAADHWREPDAGPWEVGRPARLWVADRLSAWYGLDRSMRIARAANPLDLEAVAWHQEASALSSWLDATAVGPDGGLRLAGPGTGSVGQASEEADAALLRAAWRAPWPPSHPVVSATVDRVLERLGSGLLLHRYSDQVADERDGPDNPDVESSLLAVRALSALGRWDEAHERMEAVVAALFGPGADGAPKAGLPTATADPVSGDVFGDFPYTPAALALVDAALALERGPY